MEHDPILVNGCKGAHLAFEEGGQGMEWVFKVFGGVASRESFENWAPKNIILCHFLIYLKYKNYNCIGIWTRTLQLKLEIVHKIRAVSNGKSMFPFGPDSITCYQLFRIVLCK